MNPAALPYSLLLLLAEFAVGAQLTVCAVDLRGLTTRSFVKMGAALSAILAAAGVWVALEVPPVASVSGYPLEPHFWNPVRMHFELLLLLSILYVIALFISNAIGSRIVGVVTAISGVILLFFLSGLIEGPTWSFAGAAAGLLTGGLALGGVTLTMSLGHWYLVTPRLPERPLNELTVALLVVLLLQSILLAAGLFIPARTLPSQMTISLAENPAIWLRAGVGLLLPLVLCFMAWRCSRAREMMSATGLLYLATGAVLAGQALACSLLFSTGVPG